MLLNCYRFSITVDNKRFDINLKYLKISVLIFLYKFQIRNAVTLVYGFQTIKPQNTDGVDWGKLNPDILVYRRKVYHSVFRISAMTTLKLLIVYVTLCS